MQKFKQDLPYASAEFQASLDSFLWLHTGDDYNRELAASIVHSVGLDAALSLYIASDQHRLTYTGHVAQQRKRMLLHVE